MVGKALIFLCYLSVTYAQKTTISVYYESLCPDSRAFVIKQLYPVVKNLKDQVDLQLIPFGKSSYRTQGSDIFFTCNHGKIECYGNKIHACAMRHLEESLILDYIACLMGDGFRDKTYSDFAKECATNSHIENFDSIEQCANSTEGSDLLKEMGDKTSKFEQPLRSVPTIVINESYDPEIQDQSLFDFVGAVCPHLPKPSPKICHKSDGATSVHAFGALFTVLITVALHVLK